MQKVVPCLWFDKEADEAIDFYLRVDLQLGSPFQERLQGRLGRTLPALWRKLVGRPGGRAVRVVEGQVRAFVADRPQAAKGVALRTGSRESRPGHGRPAADEEDRRRGAAQGLRRGLTGDSRRLRMRRTHSGFASVSQCPQWGHVFDDLGQRHFFGGVHTKRPTRVATTASRVCPLLRRGSRRLGKELPAEDGDGELDRAHTSVGTTCQSSSRARNRVRAGSLSSKLTCCTSVRPCRRITYPNPPCQDSPRPPEIVLITSYHDSMGVGSFKSGGSSISISSRTSLTRRGVEDGHLARGNQVSIVGPKEPSLLASKPQLYGQPYRPCPARRVRPLSVRAPLHRSVAGFLPALCDVRPETHNCPRAPVEIVQSHKLVRGVEVLVRTGETQKDRVQVAGYACMISTTGTDPPPLKITGAPCRRLLQGRESREQALGAR